MGKDLADTYDVARKVFAEVDDALGESLTAIMWDGPAERLTLTENAQPALMAVSLAAMRVLEAEKGWSVKSARYVAGHSLGEYSALAAAGSLDLADAARLLRIRGKAMQEAVPVGVGAMAALFGLSGEAVAQVCTEAAQGEVVSAANLNGGEQIVVAGHAEAVRRAIAAAKVRGAKRAVELTVSAPFHCALMSPAAEGLARVLETVPVSPLRVGVISNVRAEVNEDPQQVKDLLVRQVTAPVRWEESMQSMQALGCEAAIEIGPGRVLAGLLKRIVPGIPCVSVSEPAALEEVRRVAG